MKYYCYTVLDSSGNYHMSLTDKSFLDFMSECKEIFTKFVFLNRFEITKEEYEEALKKRDLNHH